jgi:hypothetical protein
MRTRVVLAGVVVLALVPAAGASYGASQAGSVEARAAARLGPPIAGTHCHAFPADDYWHADIRHLPVDRRSKVWLSHMSTSVDLHPDFGPSFGDGPNYGMPITVVGANHPKVRVRFTYASESDHLRYPLGHDTRIEGGRRSTGDRHALIVDRSTCRLYETYATRERNGRWYAGSGATWSLTSDKLRPDGWTSADAAGLPILPGLLRWNEVKHLHVDHAIRFTTDLTSAHHLWPARHDASSLDSWKFPPMGARFRLRASYHPSGFGPRAMAVVRAMKTYGLVLADNGSPWFFQGEQNAAWPIKLVDTLKRIPADQFVAVDTSSLKITDNSGAAR